MTETVEASAQFAERVSQSGMPSAAWPIGFVVGIGLLVVLSVGSSALTGRELPADRSDAGPTDARPSDGLPSATPTAPEAPLPFDLFLPASEDVVVGSCVPVAGRLSPEGRRAGPVPPTSVTILVANDEGVVGRGTIPIVNLAFAGCLSVDSPQEGRRFDVVAFTTKGERELGRVSIILATAASATP